MASALPSCITSHAGTMSRPGRSLTPLNTWRSMAGTSPRDATSAVAMRTPRATSTRTTNCDGRRWTVPGSLSERVAGGALTPPGRSPVAGAGVEDQGRERPGGRPHGHPAGHVEGEMGPDVLPGEPDAAGRGPGHAGGRGREHPTGDRRDGERYGRVAGREPEP